MSEKCQRCNKSVYANDQPSKVNGIVFHGMCFKCVTCGSKLNMKSFKTNPDANDKEVYCLSHDPLKKVHQDASQEVTTTMAAAMAAPSKADAMGSLSFQKSSAQNAYGSGAIGTEGAKVKPDAMGKPRNI